MAGGGREWAVNTTQAGRAPTLVHSCYDVDCAHHWRGVPAKRHFEFSNNEAPSLCREGL